MGNKQCWLQGYSKLVMFALEWQSPMRIAYTVHAALSFMPDTGLVSQQPLYLEGTLQPWLELAVITSERLVMLRFATDFTNCNGRDPIWRQDKLYKNTFIYLFLELTRQSLQTKAKKSQINCVPQHIYIYNYHGVFQIDGNLIIWGCCVRFRNS